MKELVAKKYVKALLQAVSVNEIDSFSKELSKIALAFKVKEFSNIVSSPDVTNEKKVELISSICNSSDVKLSNLLKLLAEKNRLSVIPAIATELQEQNSKLKNEYIGTVCSNTKISNEQISLLEAQFGKRFNAKIKLEQTSSSTNGVKISVDGLGIEIGFSREKIQAQLLNHIMKAI